MMFILINFKYSFDVETYIIINDNFLVVLKSKCLLISLEFQTSLIRMTKKLTILFRLVSTLGHINACIGIA